MAIKVERQIVNAVRNGIDKTKVEIKRATDLDRLGKDIVDEMKDMISKGLSPIRSERRFPGYKHQGKKGKYPNSVRNKYPGKKPRPVNLKLSGAFLKDLVYRFNRRAKKPTLRIGFFRKKSILKEKGHREGVKGQPKRPIIPDESKGEEFALRVQRVIKNFEKAIARKLALKRFTKLSTRR